MWMKMFFLYGKMSFRRFNSEIEKLMLQIKSKNKTWAKEDEAVEFDMSDKNDEKIWDFDGNYRKKKFAKKRDRLWRRKMEL